MTNFSANSFQLSSLYAFISLADGNGRVVSAEKLGSKIMASHDRNFINTGAKIKINKNNLGCNVN